MHLDELELLFVFIFALWVEMIQDSRFCIYLALALEDIPILWFMYLACSIDILIP
jgi:hypothetical protein